MTPFSFDHATAREITGDDQARHIEAKARQDADAGAFDPPTLTGESYWSQVQSQMCIVVYRVQHQKRLERNLRKSAQIKPQTLPDAP